MRNYFITIYLVASFKVENITFLAEVLYIIFLSRRLFVNGEWASRNRHDLTQMHLTTAAQKFVSKRTFMSLFLSVTINTPFYHLEYDIFGGKCFEIPNVKK